MAIRQTSFDKFRVVLAREAPDVEPEWVVRAIAEPNLQDWDRNDIYYSWVPERQRWLKVVVEDDRIATAHIDRRMLRILGVPEND